ncbi:benzoate-CoA ligase family protein [Sneathiella aquimaris]|uniref:benzoate-CoA ligase family protein n=1 Tax=Sneathiella aquimaris TaxID=2599305 RepID=UPI00146B024A|nr:benzoate-CoA ligase family protein [Sneathiella aquimaris]
MGQVNENAAAYFVDRHAKGAAAEKVAFTEAVDGGRSLTYAALGEQSGKMTALFEKYHIQPEDRVVMLVHDVVEFPVIFWGSLKAGVIPVPVNTLLAADLYALILDDSKAKSLFVSEVLLDVVKPVLKDRKYLKSVFVIGESQEGFLSFNDELATVQERPTTQASADECAFWLYSSGSTGQPKGVRHVHGSLQATSDTYGAQTLKINVDDVVFSVAKLFFAYGLGNGMTFPMSVGATTVLYPGRPTPETVFDVIRRSNPTVFCGVPTLYAALVSAMPDKMPNGMERLRCCISAGEALPAEIGRKWKSATGVDILDGVGSTEMLHIFLSNAPDDVVYGTSGRAVPGYQLRLVDETGAEVGAGEIGELLVNGPSAADGYWNQRDKTRSTFEGVWTRTGDKYEKQADGRLVYCGRTDDMFKVSGIWVSPFEIEQALVTHKDVLEAAVVAAMDENDLEKPKAYVVLKDAVSKEGLEERLKEHVKEAVGKWKYPRWIEIVDDLPKTATGKVQRFKLRSQ